MPSCETDAIWDREEGGTWLSDIPSPSVRPSLSPRVAMATFFPLLLSKVGGLVSQVGGALAGLRRSQVEWSYLLAYYSWHWLEMERKEGETSGGVEGALPGAQRPAGRVTPKRRTSTSNWLDRLGGRTRD